MSICEVQPAHAERSEILHHALVSRGTHWLDARARILGLEPRQQEVFTRLVAHIEAGWSRVRALQEVYDRHASLEAGGGPLGDVLGFIDSDVVDLFRVVAFDAADLVPGWEGWHDAADPGDMDGDALLFARYVGILRLAAQSREIDPAVSAEVERACTALQGWYPRLTDLLRVIDEEVIRPSLPPDEW